MSTYETTADNYNEQYSSGNIIQGDIDFNLYSNSEPHFRGDSFSNVMNDVKIDSGEKDGFGVSGGGGGGATVGDIDLRGTKFQSQVIYNQQKLHHSHFICQHHQHRRLYIAHIDRERKYKVHTHHAYHLLHTPPLYKIKTFDRPSSTDYSLIGNHNAIIDLDLDFDIDIDLITNNKDKNHRNYHNGNIVLPATTSTNTTVLPSQMANTMRKNVFQHTKTPTPSAYEVPSSPNIP
ncbi:predicted protein [Lodderomyces elongisporus NRRL YB-4239]|uniref:Uncharacterized protein n=1 Tax=Lodderomyces elongisporus (strain ATCC 11503 / CBS 2605 / JCM 1781 / NBRC 1676 / NRRL YB-4239) TaxID=379508 RepID=A5E417_LODEL|nr:predicted protein [Lodderomyces elongisporus NRRL YB-4239]